MAFLQQSDGSGSVWGVGVKHVHTHFRLLENIWSCSDLDTERLSGCVDDFQHRAA